MDEIEVATLLTEDELRVRRLVARLESGGVVGHTGFDEHLLPPEDRFPGDGAELAERELELGLLQQLESELRSIDAARRRLTEGRYGRCVVCGKLIADERLRAMPTTERCVAHAS